MPPIRELIRMESLISQFGGPGESRPKRGNLEIGNEAKLKNQENQHFKNFSKNIFSLKLEINHKSGITPYPKNQHLLDMRCAWSILMNL